MEPAKDAPEGEPVLWERVAMAEWWLREYGLIPAQVGEMPAWLVARIPQVSQLRYEVIEEKQRDAMKRT